MTGRVLIIEDDPDMRDLIKEELDRRGFEAHTAVTAEHAMPSLSDQNWEAILTDLRMPGIGGNAFARHVTETRPDIPVVVITAFGTMDTAVEAIRAGAFDFVTKPIEMDLLAAAMKRAVGHHRLRNEVRVLRRQVANAGRYDRLLGESPVMRSLFDQLDQTADTDTTVLITGETGTGKELVARALHGRSKRRTKAFVPVNCGAVAENLIESELFGHVKGAFTGASEVRKGLLAQADGGTLFLDEIGEMPLSLQPKLLRVLDTGMVRPVGSDREQPCDVRILAATNRDLISMVDGGGFREDLLFRLNVIHIEVPPLRSRGRDILLLAQHILAELSARHGRDVRGFAPAVARTFMEYDWPGNVRELRNVVERAVTLTRLDQVGLDDLPERIREHRSDRLVVEGSDPMALPTLATLEKRYISQVMRAAGGNKVLAARILGFDRRTLYRKIAQNPS